MTLLEKKYNLVIQKGWRENERKAFPYLFPHFTCWLGTPPENIFIS